MKVPAPPEESNLRPGEDVDVPPLHTADIPSKPAAVKYGRKAQQQNNNTTTTTPGWRVGSVMKKRRNSNNSSKKKVVAMSKKERIETRSKMKDIKSFFMKLTDDPKLAADGGGLSTDGEVPLVQGDSTARLHGSLDSFDKVSASMNNPNVCDVQNGRDHSLCVRGDHDCGLGHECLMSRVSRLKGGEGGQIRGDGDDDDGVYSFIQSVGDEKEVVEQRWLMKTGKLPRKTDQKQTPGATRGGGSNQNLNQTLQSKILLWEGMVQSENLADYLAENGRCLQSGGQTGKL